MNYGNFVKVIFFDVYFHGSCKMSLEAYQNYNRTLIDSVHTVFDPTQLLVWDCVYLGLSACWFIVSVLLLTGELSHPFRVYIYICTENNYISYLYLFIF